MTISQEKEQATRRGGRWLKSFLALVGLLTLLFFAGSLLVRRLGGESNDQLKEIRSPDGVYKAVLLSENGGGAISPYCIDTVVVLPTATKVDSRDDSQVVYVGGCGTFRDPKTDNRRNGPDITWLKTNRLEIHFPQDSVGGVSAMRLKRHAIGGYVTVTYRIDDIY